MSAIQGESELLKATVFVLNRFGTPVTPVPVLFNPTEYSVDKSVSYSEFTFPGLSGPIVQFANGNSESLSMQLFLDTSEVGLDVRVYTTILDSLLEVDPDRHAPPICMFVWGSLVFKSVIERASKRFTMFLASGIPIRATVDVTFKAYEKPDFLRAKNPLKSADRSTTWTVTEGDTIDRIAAEEYGDPAAWRVVAEANGIDDPRTLEPGRTLDLPPLEE